MRKNTKSKAPKFYKKYRDKRLFKYVVGFLITYNRFNLCDFDLDLIFTKNIKPIKINQQGKSWLISPLNCATINSRFFTKDT